MKRRHKHSGLYDYDGNWKLHNVKTIHKNPDAKKGHIKWLENTGEINKMIITTKTFKCVLCDFMRDIKHDSNMPIVCPACSNGQNKAYTANIKEFDRQFNDA